MSENCTPFAFYIEMSDISASHKEIKLEQSIFDESKRDRFRVLSAETTA